MRNSAKQKKIRNDLYFRYLKSKAILHNNDNIMYSSMLLSEKINQILPLEYTYLVEICHKHSLTAIRLNFKNIHLKIPDI